jgi:IMP dehydrogenase
MKEYGIGGIPIIDEEHRLKGIVIEICVWENNARPIIEVMTSVNLVTVAEGTHQNKQR